MLEKLFNLKNGEFKRLIPYALLFLLIQAMLYVGEGISLSLFINRIGADKLPEYYGYTAIVIFVFIAIYFILIDKISYLNLFKLILFGSILTYFIAWFMFAHMNAGVWCFGLFLINREISSTLIFVHFPNFVLDYFTRSELNRILPIMYSFGRIGGIIGGVLLSQLSKVFGVLNLVFLYLILGIICLIILSYIKKIKFIEDSVDEQKGPMSFKDFWIFFIGSVFLILFTLNTFLFMLSRTFVNFQYNSFFDIYFTSEIQMAEYLGYYTAIALFISLLIQMFLVNRIVMYIGLKGSHLLYNILFFLSVIINFLPMTIYLATYARFVENELRFSYRNTIITLIGNKFYKNVRARARALTLGVIIPIATIIASIILFYLNNQALLVFIPFVGFFICLVYVVASFKLYDSFNEDSEIVSNLQKSKFAFLTRILFKNEVKNRKII